MATEDQVSIKTSFFEGSFRGPFAIGLILFVIGVAVLGVGIKLHNDAAHSVLLSLVFQTRVTNCLLTIPQEERKQTWRLHQCLSMEYIPPESAHPSRSN